jgi:hypothetical protein
MIQSKGVGGKPKGRATRTEQIENAYHTMVGKAEKKNFLKEPGENGSIYWY